MFGGQKGAAASEILNKYEAQKAENRRKWEDAEKRRKRVSTRVKNLLEEIKEETRKELHLFASRDLMREMGGQEEEVLEPADSPSVGGVVQEEVSQGAAVIRGNVRQEPPPTSQWRRPQRIPTSSPQEGRVGTGEQQEQRVGLQPESLEIEGDLWLRQCRRILAEREEGAGANAPQMAVGQVEVQQRGEERADLEAPGAGEVVAEGHEGREGLQVERRGATYTVLELVDVVLGKIEEADVRLSVVGKKKLKEDDSEEAKRRYLEELHHAIRGFIENSPDATKQEKWNVVVETFLPMLLKDEIFQKDDRRFKIKLDQMFLALRHVFTLWSTGKELDKINSKDFKPPKIGPHTYGLITQSKTVDKTEIRWTFVQSFPELIRRFYQTSSGRILLEKLLSILLEKDHVENATKNIFKLCERK